MNKKGAIGFSVNLLVTIIISLVILGAGITLLYQFIGGAEDIQTGLDERSEQELERLLTNQGQQVAISLHTTTIERGQSHVFGIGILNIGEARDFTVTIEPPQQVIVNNQAQPLAEPDKTLTWLLYDPGPFHLSQNENTKEAILIKPDTAAITGQYIFTVRVFAGEDQYGNVQKIYVTVK
ncbi:hypothetical protein COV20_00400 [Candidatus Woesearchaeota archaeon CG10_big_fil_rev_8_21_14_0_10_45_16]|nr:MAG: hypothetical protein COV20_00400 [Candidatus Woesearchaeota archaeon CG10_big_fil_rev_8_21_14_0_10_45_16]